jgi:hypothetical protein
MQVVRTDPRFHRANTLLHGRSTDEEDRGTQEERGHLVVEDVKERDEVKTLHVIYLAETYLLLTADRAAEAMGAPSSSRFERG